MQDTTLSRDAGFEARARARTGSGLGETIDVLLKQRSRFFERLQHDPQLTRELPTLLTIAFVAAMPVGAILGSYAGGWQILYVSLKVPLLLLFSLALCTLAFWVSALYAGLELRPAQVATLCVGSMAATSIVLLGLAPLLWLAIPSGVSEVSYHGIILAVVGVFGFAGLFGTWQLVRGLRTLAASSGYARRLGVPFLACVWLGLYALVGSQMAWILRPWLVHPWTRGGVPFLRALDSNIFEAVWHVVLRLLG